MNWSKLKTMFLCALTLSLGAMMTTPAHAADDLIQQIEKRGKMRVCFAEDNPWQFKDPATGKWSGMVKEMVDEFVKDFGVELEEVNSTWKTAVQSVNNGECDLVGANLFANLLRSKLALFSVPWAYETSTAYVKADSPFKTYEDLDQPGKIIVTKAGAATNDFAQRFFKKATVKPFPSDVDVVSMTEVAAGRADAWWNSVSKSKALLDQNPQFNLRILGAKPIDNVEIVWAMAAGQYGFQQLVNVWLRRYIDSGKMAVVWEKWFKTPYIR